MTTTAKQKKAKHIAVNVNLLPKDPFFDTIAGKSLKWALSVGRYIVIFTELIVILSFVTRFNLDRRVTDLNDAINQKKNVILSYGDLESTVRTSQDSLEHFVQAEAETNIVEQFPLLSQVTPFDVELEQLIIDNASVVILGTASNQEALGVLITNMQLTKRFVNVTIDTIEAGEQQQKPGYQFRIRADTVLDEPTT